MSTVRCVVADWPSDAVYRASLEGLADLYRKNGHHEARVIEHGDGRLRLELWCDEAESARYFAPAA